MGLTLWKFGLLGQTEQILVGNVRDQLGVGVNCLLSFGSFVVKPSKLEAARATIKFLQQ